MEQLFNGLGDLATTQVNIVGMLVLIGLVLSMAYLVNSLRNPKKAAQGADNTITVLAETFGGIIGDKLETVTNTMATMIDEVKKDNAATSDEHKELGKTLEGINTNMQGLGNVIELMSRLLTGHIKTDEENTQKIQVLTTDVKEANEAVEVMKTDIDEIKTDISDLKTTVANIEKQLDAGWNMSPDSLDIMQRFINCAKQLDETIKRTTQETEIVEPETENVIEKPKGDRDDKKV
jgi:outer membrane murein-binding lipoprotein Lpp